MEIAAPYLLFLGDAPDQLAAKTAQGLVDWAPERCLGQLRMAGCGADLGIQDLDIAEAAKRGARTLVIGVTNPGGVLPANWTDLIVAALAAGIDVASGMHMRLGDNERIAAAAKAGGRQLFDVRHTDRSFETGKGERRPGKRLLTVGTDCAVGKKYTALAIAKEMRARGIDATFRATGQTGILIAGHGVAIDAVVSDFISGAAEWLTPDAAPSHWDVVEGQGSLFHPSFAGVSMGLLHGAQPDLFVVCHQPKRAKMRGVQHALPSIRQVIDHNIACGQLTNPDIRVLGISVNTQGLPEAEARKYLEDLRAEFGLPATDPVRFGVAALVDAIA